MIWTQPKQIRPVQNNWNSAKIVWTVQNHFKCIEEQGIKKEERKKEKNSPLCDDVVECFTQGRNPFLPANIRLCQK